MKVLQVFNELRPSGAETMWVAAAEVARREEVEFHMLATGREMGPYAEEMRRVGYRILHVPHGRRRLIDPVYCWRLFQLVKNGGYDAVHVHPEAWRLTNCFIARLAGVKRITTTIHSVFDVCGWRSIKRCVCWKLLRILGVTLVSISEAVKRNEMRYGCDSVLIWNWIDETRMVCEHAWGRSDVGFSEDDVLLLILGNCSPVKNHLFLLDVLRTLPDNFKLLHVGKEDSDQSEKAYAARLGIQSRVCFLGPRTDVGGILNISDVFVMSSTHEGLGLACIEALFQGVPSVVANQGGLSDLARLIPGCFGVDLSVERFAAKIRSVVGIDSSKRVEMMDLAKREVRRKFNMEHNAMQYVNLWGDL